MDGTLLPLGIAPCDMSQGCSQGFLPQRGYKKDKRIPYNSKVSIKIPCIPSAKNLLALPGIKTKSSVRPRSLNKNKTNIKTKSSARPRVG